MSTGRTLKVLNTTKLLAKLLSLLRSYRVKTLLGKFGKGFCIVTKILLKTNKDCACFRAMVTDLREPLLLAVIKR